MKNSPSVPLLICSILLIIIGVITIATASPPFAINKGLASNHYLIHQLLYGFLPGILLGAIAFFTPLKTLKKYSLPLFILSFALMFLVFVPGIGVFEKGAARWINLFGLNFQPSEFLKLTTIIYLSAIYSSEKKKKPLSNFFTIMGLVGIAFYAQSDLSTFAIIVAASLVIIFSANIKPKDVFLAGFISLISLFLLLIPIAYRADRVLSVINPEQASDLHHKNQALISIGSGGLNGSGLGLSAQKFGFVPEAMSDSIFTIYAEELGFLGCAFLIFILMFFTFYIFSIAKKSTPFPKLMAIGIGTWIVVQSFINILAMSGLFPISGIPLPFLSYGGTHLVFELIAIGLLLNIARSINKR
ncbi:MAG: FtsW/RodA/SpoVE family cell cycle protein [Candidatus Pacebacteria bacterium]|nr:FtsW/RodA/SpoVE family cell cycle protein [Candidatus Paceibacterota bacterium]MDD3047778.1 FtsW/RodA/SpoVE family cell cycle protein [Candidatus Paceibacterota bacterium]MDD3509736.1 FtsW/RodA/SpoVE family cell cycle protein [Candidatus Paceibacterota bacterium]MDD3918675.1 FtsW/RodA/SpoVE family cell cycle protein [Candidatus Paceibacterota bacterium]MDD4664420.1 FtsW/RodA/SpoVE family cell cycle protein [Candidatus Paceibacterota bacterium]